MSRTINSFDIMQGLVTYDWDDYCKDVVVLNHHYSSDLVFLDKIRENAKRLGYFFERSLETLDYEEERKQYKIPPLYEKFSVFTKIDTEKSDEFPKEKIAVYRAWQYHAEELNGKLNGERFFALRTTFDERKVGEIYKDYIRLFCGSEGFDYNKTSLINPINTILIVIVDDIHMMLESFFPKVHKNYVLFCLISTSSPHEIFIAPDLRINNNSEYQKKIEELKFLLEIDEKGI